MARPTQSDYGVSDRAWLDIDWRKHLRQMRIGSEQIVYTDRGEGPPLVLIHGLGGCWQNWLENIPHLSERHRVLAIDLPGFGASPPSPGPVTIAGMIELVRSFCDQLGLGSETTLVGHSMGGAIAGDLVAISPGRFRRLVVVAGAGLSFAWARYGMTNVLGRVAHLVKPFTARYTEDAVLRPHLRRIVFGGVIYRPQRMGHEILFEIAAPGGPNAPSFAEAIVSLLSHDGRAQLSAVELPTLIVWGHNDRIVPVRAALSYHRRIADSRLEIFDRTGHMAMIERPRRFNAVLDRFLAES